MGTRSLLLWALVLATPARALAELPRVAVLNFKSVGEVPEELVLAFSEKLLVSIRDTGEYREVGESDFEVMLGYESFKQTLGCDDDSCLAEIAGAAGVGLLLTGTIIRDGDTYTVLAKLLDTSQASVVGRIEHTIEGGSAKLLAAARIIIGKVFGRDTAATAPHEVTTTADSRGIHMALGWTAVGVGSAALITGGLFLRSAFTHKTEADDIYESQYEPATTAQEAENARDSIATEIDRYNSRLTVSTVALGVGAAVLGYGLFELFTLPEATATVVSDGRGVSIVGWF